MHACSHVVQLPLQYDLASSWWRLTTDQTSKRWLLTPIGGTFTTFRQSRTQRSSRHRVSCHFLFECARFNRRSQEEGESAEQFYYGTVHNAESCEYGILTSGDQGQSPFSERLQDGTPARMNSSKHWMGKTPVPKQPILEREAMARRQELGNSARGKFQTQPKQQCSCCGKG